MNHNSTVHDPDPRQRLINKRPNLRPVLADLVSPVLETSSDGIPANFALNASSGVEICPCMWIGARRCHETSITILIESSI